jgi:hypothetical protein
VILAEELHVDAGLVELAGDEEMQGKWFVITMHYACY